MANISPNTTVGSLPPDMTLTELAKEMRKQGLGGSDDTDIREYDYDEYIGGKRSYGHGAVGQVLIRVDRLTATVEKVGNIISKMDRQLMELLKPWRDVDNAAAKYARSVGANVAQMNNIRSQAIHDVNKQSIGLKFGMNAADLIEAQSNYVKGIGRQINLAGTDKATLAAITKVYGDSSEMFNAFDKVGVSMEGVGKHMGKMYADAAKSGLSLAKYSDNVKQGLAMANKYSFANGLKGMEAMAKRAAAIRMDMQQVESFVGSFNTLDTAISNSARLQVLGGQFATGADPLGLLNDALTDIESMQKRMEGFTRGMARFNRTTGEAKIDPHNIWKLNEYAKITGQDPSKVQEVAKRQAMRGEIDRDLRRSKNYASLSEDMREMIKNTATFKDGEFKVRIGNDYKKLSEINEKDKKALEKTTQDQREDIKDIAMHVRSLDEHREGYKKQWENVQAGMTGWLGIATKFVTALGTTINFVGKAVIGLMGAGAVFKMLTTALSWIRGGRGIVKTITKGIKEVFFGRVGRSASKIADFAGNIFKRGGGATSSAAAENVVNGAAKTSAEAAKTTAQTAKATSRGLKSLKVVRKGRQVRNLVKAGKGMKVLASGMKAAGKKIPIIGSLISAGFEAYENKDKFKDQATRGTAVGRTAGAGIGAAIGAGLGSILGPLGTIAGGIAGEWLGKHIGGFVGKIRDNAVVKNRTAVDSQLKQYGIQRKGDYGVSKLKDINEALQTGKMSNKLRRKLMKEGDIDIVNQVDAIKKQKEEDREARKDRRAERKGKKRGEGPRKVNTAYFTIQNGIFEGIKADGKNNKGVSVVGPNSLAPIGPDVSPIRGKEEKGEKVNFSKKDALSQADAWKARQNEQQTPLKVEFSGAINLKTPKGENIDILAEIKRNPQMLTQLTQMVMAEWNRQSNGGYVDNRTMGQSPMLWPK